MSYNRAMRKVTFGSTGLQVSQLGFGAAPIGYLDTERAEVTKILNLLLDSGVNLIDTAASYPGAEARIADAVGGRREEFVVVSKCGTNLPDIDEPAWSAAMVTRTVDRSLRRLRTDRLDVMLLHSCDLETLRKGEALGALVRAREAGKVRHVGYSGDNEAAAYAAAVPDVAVVQTSMNIVDQVNIERVLPAARKHNVGVMAKRPIANAAWKDLGEQPGMYKSYAATYTDRLAKMGINPAALGFSGPPQRVWPELALRFTLSQPGVHTAIIGTTSPQNAEANMAAAEKGPLPKEAVEKIRQAFRRADPHGEWLGQT
jgi:aryl-alcohol dehydrogenase-like predicted oxidoreductase